MRKNLKMYVSRWLNFPLTCLFRVSWSIVLHGFHSQVLVNWCMSCENRVDKMWRIYSRENFALHLEVFLIIVIDIFYYSQLSSACITHLKYHHTDFCCSPTLLQSACETNKWLHYCQSPNPPGSEVYPRLSWASRSDWNGQPRQSIWCCNFKKPEGGLEELITKHVSQTFFLFFPHT